MISRSWFRLSGLFRSMSVSWSYGCVVYILIVVGFAVSIMFVYSSILMSLRGIECSVLRYVMRLLVSVVQRYSFIICRVFMLCSDMW